MAYSREDKDKIFKKIFDIVEDGKSVRFALKELKHSSKSFNEWLDEVDEDGKLTDFAQEKRNQYARAIELRHEAKFDSIEADYNEPPQRDPESGRIDSAWVQLQRLKIDSKKWELSKLAPKKYGDRLDVTSKDEAITQVSIFQMPNNGRD